MENDLQPQYQPDPSQQPPVPVETPGSFQPNIYPIMYWALAYAAIGGLALFIMYLLSRFITVVWVPVFLIGLTWGAYRNYKKQKSEWAKYKGMPLSPQSATADFKEAALDIFQASRRMLAEQATEDTARQQAELQASAQAEFAEEEIQPEESAELQQPLPEEPLAEPQAENPTEPVQDDDLPNPPTTTGLPPAPPFPTNQV